MIIKKSLCCPTCHHFIERHFTRRIMFKPPVLHHCDSSVVNSSSKEHQTVKDLMRVSPDVKFTWEPTLWNSGSIKESANNIGDSHVYYTVRCKCIS